MIIMKQENELLIGDFSGQLVNVVSALNQFADVASDIAECGACRDNAFQALGIIW